MKACIVIVFSLFLCGQAFGLASDLQANKTFNGQHRAAQIEAQLM